MITTTVKVVMGEARMRLGKLWISSVADRRQEMGSRNNLDRAVVSVLVGRVLESRSQSLLLVRRPGFLVLSFWSCVKSICREICSSSSGKGSLKKEELLVF